MRTAHHRKSTRIDSQHVIIILTSQLNSTFLTVNRKVNLMPVDDGLAITEITEQGSTPSYLMTQRADLVGLRVYIGNQLERAYDLSQSPHRLPQ